MVLFSFWRKATRVQVNSLNTGEEKRQTEPSSSYGFKLYDRKQSVYIKMVYFWLTMSGLWRNSEKRNLNLFWVSTIIVNLTIGLLWGLHKLVFVSQDFEDGVEVLMFTSLIGHSITTYLVLIWKQATIMKMLSLVENCFENFNEMFKITGEFRKHAEKRNVLVVVLVASSIFSVHLSFSAVSKVYMVNLPLEEKTLLFPLTVPDNMTEPVYYSFFMLQLVILFFAAVVHITSICLYVGFTNLLCAQFSAFGQAFRVLERISQQHTKQNMILVDLQEQHSLNQRNLFATQLLKEFVIHHMLLLKFYKNLETTFALTVFDMFVNSQVMLCTSGFNVFKLYKLGKLQNLFKHFCMFTSLIAHELVYFWYGSHLTEKSSKFRLDVYACEWYKRSASFTRSYRIILERLKKPLVIKAVILPTNLHTFIKCVQAAFSYFNLLLALNYKSEKDDLMAGNSA